MLSIGFGAMHPWPTATANKQIVEIAMLLPHLRDPLFQLADSVGLVAFDSIDRVDEFDEDVAVIGE